MTEHAPVANAFGAAVSRPTMSLTPSVDTDQGSWVTEEDDGPDAWPISDSSMAPRTWRCAAGDEGQGGRYRQLCGEKLRHPQ